MSDFKIIVRFPVGTVQEWERAQQASVSDLPQLDPNQVEAAKSWGINNEDERRNALSQRFAEERLQTEGERLGRAVNGVLAGLGSEYELQAVVIDGRLDSWTVRVRTPKGIAEMSIGGDIRSRILLNGGEWGVEDLRRSLLSSLGREDLLLSR
jgi:hypothetical protein